MSDERGARVGASPPLSRSPGCGGGGALAKLACSPLLSRPLPASQGRAAVLCFSLLSTTRQTPAGGGACVRTRCWGPRRAGARFRFRRGEGVNRLSAYASIPCYLSNCGRGGGGGSRSALSTLVDVRTKR
jgi:hypothetical protein